MAYSFNLPSTPAKARKWARDMIAALRLDDPQVVDEAPAFAKTLGLMPNGDLALREGDALMKSELLDEIDALDAGTVRTSLDLYATGEVYSKIQADAQAGVINGRLTSLESTVTTNQIVKATWATLAATSGAIDGQGAEVLDTDTGSHLAASGTGYDGASTPNAGRYSWAASWSRWVRIGATGLSGKADARRETYTNSPQPGLDGALMMFRDAAKKLFGFVKADSTWWLPHAEIAGLLTAQGDIEVKGEVKRAGVVLTPKPLPTVMGDLLTFRDANKRAILRVNSAGHLASPIDPEALTEVVAARGSRADLNTRLSQHLAPFGVPKNRFGRERLRETAQRLMCLKLGETRQFVVASIGDSWTHNAGRWSGVAAARMASLYGDAGGGWVGFGSGAGGTLDNGNARPTSYIYSRSGAGWAFTVYTTGIGPDLGQITSSTAGDKVTISGPSAPTLSAAKLIWIGTANGVVRYRWNGGAWTTLNVQGTVGSLQSADLVTGMPGAGAWTLEIEVVSGTVSLCGTDIKSAANGVRWAKLGATGSTAQQWAAINAAQWQAGLALLGPNLIVIMLATNDQGASRTPAQYAADLAVIIDRCRAACPTADILVMMPAENQRVNTYAMAAYAAAALEVVAARDAAWCDTQLAFGVNASDYASGSSRPWFNADTIHPDPATGGRALAAAFLDMIGA